MGETANTNTVESAPKKSKIKALKSEFKKIVWPDKESITKQTIAVVTVSIALGLIIAAVDFVIKIGIDSILK